MSSNGAPKHLEMNIRLDNPPDLAQESGRSTMPPDAPGSNGLPASPSLDIEKLHSLPSEQQDLYLLTFSSDLARHVGALDFTSAKAQQDEVKREVLKIVSLNSPAATRVIRNNLGICLTGILSKGDRKILFETINELVTILNNSGKTERDLRSKHVAVYCLGAVFETAGDSAIGSSALVCSSILKLQKPAQNNVGLRGGLFRALGRVVRGIGNSIDEGVVRDISKQARNAASGDKSLFVQTTACWCMEQLQLCTSFFDNSADYERLQSVLWRSMESSSPVVRRAAASCLASALVKNHSLTPSTVVRTKRIKKARQKTGDQTPADEVERPGSPTSQKPVTALSFSLIEILRQLSAQYCRGTTNRVRAAIAYCYSRVLKGLDTSFIRTQYELIATHFLQDLLSSPTVQHHRYRLLLTRKLVRRNLGELLGREILSEASQFNAIKFLVNGILKDYPQSDVKERPEPIKEALIGAVDALSLLIEALGSAASPLSDLCRDTLLQVLQHPSHSVQIHVSKCLQTLVRACPQQLISAATLTLNSLGREVAQLTSPRRSPRRCLGFAHGLTAVISTAGEEPLYGSLEVYSRIFSQATIILKSSSGSDLRISSTQIQVAWIMITGLMTLGPDFVKIHLSQLLLLWKNALPPPLSAENIGRRNLLELSFLSHVRECALSAMSVFLAFNGRLLTVDVAQRLAGMLKNTTSFLTTLPGRKASDNPDNLLFSSLQLSDYDLMLRRRIFQCYTELFQSGPESNQEIILQSQLLSMAVSAFSQPETHSGARLGLSINLSSSTSESVWDLGDVSPFGLTGLVERPELNDSFRDEEGKSRRALFFDISSDPIDRLIRSPVISDIEHDPTQLLLKQSDQSPDPLQTSVVNNAIRLFSHTVLHQSPSVQQGALEQMSSYLSAASQQQNSAREQAVTVNVIVALLLSLHMSSVKKGISGFSSAEVHKAIQELLNVAIIDPDPIIRSLASEAIGRLCKVAGIDFTAREVTHLTETIVSNREPHARSGCAAALGCVHSQLGGMAASIHLKNTVNVLTSLASDPHPTVHFSALDALVRVAESAGPAFSSFVSNVLGLLAQLYVLDSHNDEAALLASSNAEIDYPSCVLIARNVDAMINVLGPDLQDSSKTRSLLLTLTYQFDLDKTSAIAVETLRCLEHLSMYALDEKTSQAYVHRLQGRLSDSEWGMREAALSGLYNAMQGQPERIISLGGSLLEQQLWLTLHDMYGKGVVLRIINDWVSLSGLTHIEQWIARIHRVLTTSLQPTSTSELSTLPMASKDEDEADGEPPLQDEEVAGFNALSREEKDGTAVGPDTTQELLRWHARFVAMECLNFILTAVAKDLETSEETTVVDLLQPRIADVIRIAFSASTASVVDIRVEGVKVIGKMLDIFGRVPDPDFADATLLEQYQAQISSALTPAFASDSSPVLAAEAVNVCAIFISTGIVTDADRMGRILKLLVSALEDFAKENETAAIGDLKNLSSSAHVMVKLALFSAWASLQVASREQHYIKEILEPHLVRLPSLWLSSLREYARLRFEPDGSTGGAVAGSLDMIYSSMTRRVMLKFYQSAWLQFVEAIASLIDEDSEFVFNALDGKDQRTALNGEASRDHEISYRDEPVAFFFVLFGIVFEALVRSSASQSTISQQRMLETLQAMKTILTPSVAGHAIYQEHTFSESMELLDRLALIEGIEVQTVIIEIAQNLVAGHPSAVKANQLASNDEHLADDIDQLFELTRIIVLVISNHVPNLDPDQSARKQISDSAVALVTLALDALVDAAAVFPVVIKSDLHACIFHVFSTILATGICQETLVPQALPIFRRFLTEMVQEPQFDTYTQLRSALARFLNILKHAQRRDSAASIPCERNTLLATTIILSTSSHIFSPTDPLLQAFITILTDCLTNRMTTKVSAGLSRSLLLLPYQSQPRGIPSNKGAGALVAAHLLPCLLDFIANPSEVETTDTSRSIIAGALVAFALSAPSASQKAAAFSLVMAALLRRAQVEGEQVWVETSARLMEMAAREKGLFRTVVAALDPTQRSLLQEVLRMGGVGIVREEVREVEKEPSIALRFDF